MKLKLTIDGKVYEVDVEASEPEVRRPGFVPSPAAAAARATAPYIAPAAASDSQRVDESKVCRSPIAGVVVRVSAQVGQSIQANDVLIVLEAMKMESTITSPVAGKVAKVNAAVGDPVQGGQILVEFE